MADKGFTQGGRGIVDFYRVRLKADKSGYEFLDKLTDVVAEAPTLANKAFSLYPSGLEKLKPDYQDDGTLKLEPTQYQSGPELKAFIKKVARKKRSSSTRKDVTLIDGKTHKGSLDTSALVLAIAYGEWDDDQAPSLNYIRASLGGVPRTAGSLEITGEGYISESLPFEGSIADADMALPKAIFRGDVIDIASVDSTVLSAKIEKDQGFWEDYVKIAA